jgi:hypothetical protein
MLLLLLAGCTSGDLLADVDVTDATLGDVRLGYAGAVVGLEVGSATLTVETTDGDTLDVPVVLSGPRLGLLLDAAFGFGIVDVPLIILDGPVAGTDLLGTYGGLEYSAAAVVGFHHATLQNDADVMMQLSTIDLGVSGSTDWVWLTMDEASGDEGD